MDGRVLHHLGLNEGPYPPLQLMQATVGPGDRVAYGWRNFDAYPLLADMVGAEPSLAAAGVRARYRPGEGVRLTVGVRSANDVVLAALA